MVPHVPTMMVMIIASSLMMAVCMAVVGWGRRRDGLARWAVGLLLNVQANTYTSLFKRLELFFGI